MFSLKFLEFLYQKVTSKLFTGPKHAIDYANRTQTMSGVRSPKKLFISNFVQNMTTFFPNFRIWASKSDIVPKFSRGPISKKFTTNPRKNRIVKILVSKSNENFMGISKNEFKRPFEHSITTYLIHTSTNTPGVKFCLTPPPILHNNKAIECVIVHTERVLKFLWIYSRTVFCVSVQNFIHRTPARVHGMCTFFLCFNDFWYWRARSAPPPHHNVWKLLRATGYACSHTHTTLFLQSYHTFTARTDQTFWKFDVKCVLNIVCVCTIARNAFQHVSSIDGSIGAHNDARVCSVRGVWWLCCTHNMCAVCCVLCAVCAQEVSLCTINFTFM